MTFLGIIFIVVVVYIVVNLKQQEDIRKEDRKRYEAYRRKPDTRDEHMKAMDDLLLESIAPFAAPPDISLEEK